MARYLKSVCRKSRRAGRCLGLKRRDISILKKCPKLKIPTGQHGSRRRKLGDYSLQLKAKQTIKYVYGVLEKQFRRYYRIALRNTDMTGTFLLGLLESRLDNVVYRMGFASTRAEARQLVSHKGIMVKRCCGKDTQRCGTIGVWRVVNIPSFNVLVGDLISVREKSKKQARVLNSLKINRELGFPKWVTVNIDEMCGLFKSIPLKSELEYDFNEQLVVELYSK
jgi:small subunit ribosomal protein S4